MEYICLDCGGVFEVPATRWEYHNETRPGWWERHSRSPCCEGGYVPVYRCPGCGRGLEGPEVGSLCMACARAARERLGRFLRRSCTPEERQALDVLTEGVSFTVLGQEERKVNG